MRSKNTNEHASQNIRPIGFILRPSVRYEISITKMFSDRDFSECHVAACAVLSASPNESSCECISLCTIPRNRSSRYLETPPGCFFAILSLVLL